MVFHRRKNWLKPIHFIWKIQALEDTTTFIHLVVCLTTGPKPLPKRALHLVRSRASSFKWEYPLLSLRSSSSFLRLLPRLPVTSIPPFIFPSITRWRRQFLRKMWPIQFAFRLLISCRIFFCSLTTSSFLTWSIQLIFSILLQHRISKLSRCFCSTARSVHISAPYKDDAISIAKYLLAIRSLLSPWSSSTQYKESESAYLSHYLSFLNWF